MKLNFASVDLLDEVERLGGNATGYAYAHTSRFRAEQGYTVTLDTATQLITITHRTGGAVVVPRERVKRFEPLPEPKAEEPAPAKK